MNNEQKQLWQKLIDIFEQIAELKFANGTIEHPGKITDMTYEQLELAETEEIIDLVHYRMTKILKKQLEDEKQT